MNNIIVECRNKTAISPVQNGDWNTILPESILLENGDSVLVKNSFIDTQQTTSSKIRIEDDLTLKLDFGFYMTNLTNVAVDPGGTETFYQKDMFTDYNFNAYSDKGDLDEWVLCKRSSHVLTATDNSIEKYVVETIDKNEKSIASTVTFKWTDFTGFGKSKLVRLPELDAGDFYEIQEMVNIIYDTTGGPPVATPSLESLNLKLFDVVQSPTPGASVLEPYLVSLELTVPSGNYEPSELCELINDIIQQNNPRQSNNIIENQTILQDGIQIQERFQAGGSNTEEFFMCKTTARTSPLGIDSMHNLPTHNPPKSLVPLFGSSNFQLAYDDDNGRFLFKYLHMPFYNAGTPTIGYFQSSYDNKFTVITRAGGIFFNQLSATDTNGNQIDFFGKTLGFDLNSLLSNYGYAGFNIGSTVKLLHPFQFDLTTGQSITGGLTVLDGVVAKSKGDFFTNAQTKSLPAYSTTQTNITDSIYSNIDKALDTQMNFGYYLIEVNAQFKNKYMTESNNFSHISQIVSRYYELDSYTSGESGTIVYTHSGEPTMLQSFHCRILTSDKDLAPNLGDDNSIILEIIKAEPEEKSK